jgi:hypothetical protein
MPRVSIVLASLGLALNLVLWSVPSLFASSSALQYALNGHQPSLAAQVTTHPLLAGSNPRDALVRLIDAEVEAMQVAGLAIQEPQAPDLGPRADAAGARVLEAVASYVQVVRAALPN